MTKRPFMAAVMLAEGRSVKHLQRVRTTAPRSCPDIAADRPEAGGFQPGYQRNLPEHSSKLSKLMNLPPRSATNQSGVFGSCQTSGTISMSNPLLRTPFRTVELRPVPPPAPSPHRLPVSLLL